MNDTTWIEEFASEIDDSEVPDIWRLYVDKNLLKNNKAKYFTRETFGSFRCLHCKRAWNSSQVLILFRMNLNKHQKHGNVTMRIFKQECQSCNMPIMQEPTILYENRKKVISNVVNHIQRVFYGKTNVNDNRPPTIYGKLDGPHDKEHCEACRFNLCDKQSTQESTQESSIATGVLTGAGLAAIGAGLVALIFAAKN